MDVEIKARAVVTIPAGTEAEVDLRGVGMPVNKKLNPGSYVSKVE